MYKIEFNDMNGWTDTVLIIGSLQTAIDYARNMQFYLDCAAHISNA